MFASFACNEVQRDSGWIGNGLVEVPRDVGQHREVLVETDDDLMVIRAETVGYLPCFRMLTDRLEADGERLHGIKALCLANLLDQGDGDGTIDTAAQEGAHGDIRDEVMSHGVLKDIPHLGRHGGLVVVVLVKLVSPVATGREHGILEVDHSNMSGFESLDSAEEGLGEGVVLKRQVIDDRLTINGRHLGSTHQEALDLGTKGRKVASAVGFI